MVNVCGIAGIVHTRKKDYKAVISHMLECMAHRGPDERGEHYYSQCALGHVRLSIIDIQNGHQPMIQQHPPLGLVFNGEIYGYQEIRDALCQRSPYPFSTDSDTEVILALYQERGARMLDILPGMFAFALWDEEQQKLFCARDRFGEKPFYYTFGTEGEFIFSSEIKSILASGLVRPRLDYGQAGHFLRYSYVYPTGTIYKNVHVLPPAHALVWQDGKVSVYRYWTLPQNILSIGEQEAVEEFERLFRQAVKRQLIADVPVGAFLSGGVDSGTVVAVAAEEANHLTTISFSFKDGIDEGYMARSMAKRYGTNHIEISDLDFDIAALLQDMQKIVDSPFADPAMIPAYLIAKCARHHAKVVLTGDAGDELLGGYDSPYKVLAYMRTFLQYGNKISYYGKYLRAKEKLLRAIYEHELKAQENRSMVHLQSTALRDTVLRETAIRWMELNPADIAAFVRERGKILPEAWEVILQLPADGARLIQEGFLDSDDLDNALRVHLLDYLPGNGFYKTDTATMSVSLESRTPFCDKDLAEFCLRLPFHFKVRKQQGKYILRKAFQDKWTRPVRNGNKNGFSPPLAKWLRNPAVMELKAHYLREPKRKIFHILPYEGIQSLLGCRKYAWPEWCLLNFSMWLESHECGI